jgi:hypothetical protein
MVVIKRSLIGCGAVLLMSTVALATGPGTPFPLLPGDTPLESLTMSEIEAQAAQLQAAWLAGGYPSVSTMPAVTAGSIMSGPIDVANGPAAPEIEVTFTVDSNTYLWSIDAEFVAPTTGQSIVVPYQTPFGVQGLSSAPGGTTIDIQSPPGFALLHNVGSFFTGYSESGIWTLNSLTITDEAGNSTTYSANQLQTIFSNSTIRVKNTTGYADTTTPQVTPPAGSIINNPPMVSLSSEFPSLGTQFNINGDTGPGTEFAYVCATPPGSQQQFCSYTNATAPFTGTGPLNGWMCLGDLAGCYGYVNNNNQAPLGQWEIATVELCDVPGNCFAAPTPSAVETLFGTTTPVTFTVTQ